MSTAVGEMGHEDGLPGQDALAGTDEGSQETTGIAGAVTHLGIKVDILFHVIHGTGFGDHRLLRIQLNLDHLHVVSNYFKINFVASHFLLLTRKPVKGNSREREFICGKIPAGY